MLLIPTGVNYLDCVTTTCFIFSPSCHFALGLLTSWGGEEGRFGVRGEVSILDRFVQIWQCTWKNYKAQ